jgi:hypothetical protein
LTNASHIKEWRFYKDTRRSEDMYEGKGEYDDGTFRYSVVINVRGDREKDALVKVLETIRWTKAHELQIKEFLFSKYVAEYTAEEVREEYDFTKDDAINGIDVIGLAIWCEYDDYVFAPQCNFDHPCDVVAPGAWVDINSNFLFFDSGLAD